ncbi:MAG: hypothetical protein R3B48_20435 [Kofleriaceae bacterium]
MLTRACAGLWMMTLAIVATSACRRSADQVPCGAVAARLLVVAQAELTAGKIDDALRQRVAMQLPALRDAVDTSCVKGDWAVEVRRCMVGAADGATLAACQRELTPAQRAELDAASHRVSAP